MNLAVKAVPFGLRSLKNDDVHFFAQKDRWH